jgi:4-hydroxy 2-oxovalerate aldolase
MNNNFEILDCTLRDGGYYTDWDFSKHIIDMYVAAMRNSPISYIEIGYRGKESTTYLGEYYFLPIPTIRNLRKELPNKKLSVMLNAKEWEGDEVNLRENLKRCQKYIDLVRIAADPNKPESTLSVAREVHKVGLPVFINIMYSHIMLRDDYFLNLLQKECPHDAIYVVDSFGCLEPENIKELIRKCRKIFKRKLIGFHGHNNMELAFANSIAALESGADLIDATVTGIGRGAGNLRTELLLSYLGLKKGWDINFSSLADVVDKFEAIRLEKKWGVNLPYILSGLSNAPQGKVMELLQTKRYSTDTIVRNLNEKIQKNSNNKKHRKLNLVFEKALIIGGGSSVFEQQESIKQYLKKNRKLALIFAGTRNLELFLEEKNIKLICLTGDEYKKIERQRRLKETKYKNLYFIVPEKSEIQVYLPTKLQVCKVMSQKFLSKFLDSPLSVCVSAAIQTKTKNIYLAGFDGYPLNEGEVSRALFIENQKIFDIAIVNELNLISLTKSKYTGLTSSSIFSKLENK